MAATPKISVVVATHDRSQRLLALLDSLESQSVDASFYEVIVVDDGSHEPVESELKRVGAGVGSIVRVIRRQRSGGPATARNDGWRAARAQLVAFTDDDCEVSREWLERMLEASAQVPGSIIQGRTEPIPRELDRIGPFSLTRQITGSGPLWFETCNILYPRELLEAVGGFDETFSEALGEDTDLGWRAMATGAGHHFRADAIVYHAVENVGVLGHLKTALRGADAVVIFIRHPQLRASALSHGVIRNHDHLRLVLAMLGLLGARRLLPMALLAIPYAKRLAGRWARGEGGAAHLAYWPLFDMLTLYTTVKGDIRHKVLVI